MKSRGRKPICPIYSRFASRYDKSVGGLERSFLASWRARAFSQLPKASNVLEIGAGTGLNATHYQAAATGIVSEPSLEMLEIARERSWPAGIDLAQCDGQFLPFANGVFDAAIATLVFCSIPDTGLAFKEVQRVVRTGGKLIVLEHVRPANLLGPVFDLINLATVPLFGDHFNRRTAQRASEAGLKIESIETFGRGIFQLIVCRV